MNEIHLYNSEHKNTEKFEPIEPGVVKMYHCGPTVYNFAHIGNLRSFVTADILRRTMEMNGLSVKQVINITDVGHLTDDGDDGEDKIERQAHKEKKTAQEIASFFTEAFFADIHALNITTTGTHFPRASEHITEQIELIQELEKNGYAYRTSDGIYFDTSKLSHYDIFASVGDDLLHGARVEINSEKRSHTDFALWKFSKPEESRQQEWDSPWGIGYPGWHLECSAMSMKYLGEQFDIHTGGIDHKFPHHPNENAQSVAATGKEPFVKYWMHVEFLSITGSKMAKSGENFITLRDVTEHGFDPLSYRYWLLMAHYRTPVSFSWEALTAADTAYKRLKKHILSYPEDPEVSADEEYSNALQRALNSDLNTPEALATLWELVKDEGVSDTVKRATARYADTVLGLQLTEEDSDAVPVIPDHIKELLEEREKARKDRDWERSDALRDKIQEQGFTVKDTPNGPELTSL